jgi:cobalt transporter subunit CbtA
MAHIITAIAYSLLLIAGFAIYGRNVTLLKGLLWGGAGFLSFSFLPGLGLPAELPGATRADLMDRQLWWLATAFLSIIGFSLIAFGKANLLRFSGVIALVLPHIFGAPGAVSAMSGPSSPELAAKFVMLSLFVSAIMWIAISSMSVFIYMRPNGYRGFFSFLGR